MKKIKINDSQFLEIVNSVLNGMYSNPDPQICQEIRTDRDGMLSYVIETAEAITQKLSQKEQEQDNE